LCNGDPYRSRSSAAKSGSRWKGQRFRTGGKLKKGQSGEGIYLSKCPRLCIGDPYMDRMQRRRAYAKKVARMHRLASAKAGEEGEEPTPFVPSGRTRRSRDLYLSECDASMTQTDIDKVTAKRKKEKRDRALALRARLKGNDGDAPSAPRNFYTAPGKKGSYGVVGITLSEKTEWGRKTLAYMPDPDETKAERARAERRAQRAKRGDRPPFAVRALDTRKAAAEDGEGHALTARRPEQGTKAKGVARPGSAPPRRRHGAGDAEEELPPWRPSNPAKSGHESCVSKFPAWVRDPVHEAVFRKRGAEDEDPEARAWMPCGGLRTRVSPSVALNGRNIRQLTSYRSGAASRAAASRGGK
jgi:hypothetical protein